MNNACYIISSVNLRYEDLIQLLTSIIKYQPFSISLCLQKYTDLEIKNIKKLLEDNKIKYYLDIQEQYIGANLAKINALKNCIEDHDYFINLDDDMTLCYKTSYTPIFEFLDQNKGIGLVSGNWRKSLKMINDTIKLKDKPFKKQNIVYTGGGLVYRKNIARLILDKCTQDYLMDDVEWSINCYINGYENYRYLNSFLEHRVCSKNGRITIYKGQKKVFNNELYFNLRKMQKDVGYESYCIPMDKDLTEYAHKLHKENKKIK